MQLFVSTILKEFGEQAFDSALYLVPYFADEGNVLTSWVF
jgi:hypothetical protein